jgi:hypothetical protein
MSFQTFVTQRLEALTARINAIDTNAKKIDELPIQTNINAQSKIHVSKGGVSESLEVSKLLDAFVNLKYDRLVSVGEITITNGVASVPSNAQWIISNINYQTQNITAIPIPLTTMGFVRTDLLVGNQIGNIVRVAGIESATTALRPNIPLGTVLITAINITSIAINAPTTPILGEAFIEKSLQESFLITNSGVLNNFVLAPNYNFSFTGNISQVNRFAFDSNSKVFVGKRLSIKNFQSTDIVFPKTEFWLLSDADLVLKPLETVEFIVNSNEDLNQIGIAPFDNTINETAITNKQSLSEKNQFGGYLGIGADGNIKLDAYPSTRNDGQLPTNKVLSTDVDGNFRLFTIATSPPPFLEVLVPDSTLPSTTTNFVLKGAFFTPTMTVSIVGQTINYITFVSDNLVKVNVTTGATEGSFAVTLNNGLQAVFPNALFIVLGTVFTPETMDWEAPTGNVSAVDDTVSINVWNTVGSNRWGKQFDNTKQFRVDFQIRKSPLGFAITDQEYQFEQISLVKSSDNSVWFGINFVKPGGGNGFYALGYEKDFGFVHFIQLDNAGIPTEQAWDLNATNTYSFRYLNNLMYIYINNILVKTFISGAVNQNLKLKVRTKSFDIYNIKYIELA